MTINLPVISNAGNMAAIVTKGHRANPAVVSSPCEYGRRRREEVPATETKREKNLDYGITGRAGEQAKKEKIIN